MKAYFRLRPDVFDAHANAPLSEHEWIQREEARARHATKYGPQLAQGPMKRLLDGTLVPEVK